MKTMVDFKLVISDPKTGKSYQKEIKDDLAKPFLGMKIGDKIKGELVDLTGYEFEIRGGSDYCGFPMRKDIKGQIRKMIFAVSGVGIKKKITTTKKGDRKIRRKRHGVKQRKTICGNTIHANISQINLMVIKSGSKPLGGEQASEETPEQGAEKKPEQAKEKVEAPEAKKPEAVKEKVEASEQKPKQKPEQKEVKPEAVVEKKDSKAEEKAEGKAEAMSEAVKESKKE